MIAEQPRSQASQSVYPEHSIGKLGVQEAIESSLKSTLEDITMEEDRELADELFGSGTEVLQESRAETAVSMDINPPTLLTQADDHPELVSPNPDIIENLKESIERNKQSLMKLENMLRTVQLQQRAPTKSYRKGILSHN
jgi:hypothetical protein